MRFLIINFRFLIWLGVAALVVVFAISDVAPAQEPGAAKSGTEVDFVEITPQLRRAVQRGLAYLASAQADDGSYGQRYGKHVGITALACLAFMADGNLPGRGRYGEQVQKGLKFVLDNARESGLIAGPNTSHGPMYGHGFATLFLAEVYGMTQDRRIREKLTKAVRMIVATQNHEGGWRYQPVPRNADLSVTICQIMALRAARNSGVSVPSQTIERSITYVRRCQNSSDGGFRYMLHSGGSQFPRSAAGVASLYYAGVYDDAALDKGLDYLMRQKVRGHSGGHYFYGHYYAVQATYLAGGEYWQQWFPWIREQLLARQNATGQWKSTQGEDYGTAMALLILQIPNRLLPIFQR